MGQNVDKPMHGYTEVGKYELSNYFLLHFNYFAVVSALTNTFLPFKYQ